MLWARSSPSSVTLTQRATGGVNRATDLDCDVRKLPCEKFRRENEVCEVDSWQKKKKKRSWSKSLDAMTEFRISLLLKSFKYYFLVKETEELLMLKKNKKQQLSTNSKPLQQPRLILSAVLPTHFKLDMTVAAEHFVPPRKVRMLTFTIYSLYCSALSAQTESHFPVSDRPVRT